MDTEGENDTLRVSMSLEHTRTTKIEDGEEKDCLRIDFTNGALEQLEDLKSLVKSNDPVDVIKAAISLMQNIKDSETKAKS